MWFASLLVLVAYVLAYSAWTVTHGFVAYYGAARLLADAQLSSVAYDDAWFGAFVRAITGTSVREIFTPNPPTMALMAAPIVWLDHGSARIIWLFASLTALAAASYALLGYRERAGLPFTALVIALVLLNPSTVANLRTGQGYLFVFALLTGAALAVIGGHDRRAGVLLGIAFALKATGLPLVLLLFINRRWRAIQAFVVVVIAIVGVTALLVETEMWWRYPSVVTEFVRRPSGSVTAYQTTLGFFRRMCIADAQWNPNPPASCGSMAFIVPQVIFAAAMLTTIVLSRRAPAPLWVAAAVCLSELQMPAAAEPHFILFAAPVALLTMSPLLLGIFAFLFLIPLAVTAQVFTDGWWIFAAYPRLYAVWLVWAVAIAASIRGYRHSPTARV